MKQYKAATTQVVDNLKLLIYSLTPDQRTHSLQKSRPCTVVDNLNAGYILVHIYIYVKREREERWATISKSLPYRTVHNYIQIQMHVWACALHYKCTCRDEQSTTDAKMEVKSSTYQAYHNSCSIQNSSAVYKCIVSQLVSSPIAINCTARYNIRLCHPTIYVCLCYFAI